MIRFASLGSGSAGNALLVESGQSRLLLDCGFSAAETERRLTRLGIDPQTLDAILVTHEHDDHIGGVARVSRRFDVPVYLTHGSFSAVASRQDFAQTVLIDSHQPFTIGDIEIQPFPVPHDAREPTQFVFSDGATHLGVLTDTGASTPHIESMLSGLEALVIECNHDGDMLSASAYPDHLKMRIGGRLGHLENAQAAQILRSIDCASLQHVIAAHLSRKNNHPELAARALAGALGCSEQWIAVATQEQGFGWREIAPKA